MSKLKLSLLAAALALGFSAATILPAEAAAQRSKTEQSAKNKKKTNASAKSKKQTTHKNTKAKSTKAKPHAQPRAA